MAVSLPSNGGDEPITPCGLGGQEWVAKDERTVADRARSSLVG